MPSRKKQTRGGQHREQISEHRGVSLNVGDAGALTLHALSASMYFWLAPMRSLATFWRGAGAWASLRCTPLYSTSNTRGTATKWSGG